MKIIIINRSLQKIFLFSRDLMDRGGKCHHHSEPLLTSQEENSTVRILLVGNIILWLMKNSIINTFFL